MARLPIPGSDDNTWGDILNDFLSQEHNADGSQKTLSVTKGGTGVTSITSGSYLLGAGTGAITSKTVAQVKTDLGITGSATLPTFTQSGTYYVTADGNDSNDGLSWGSGLATVAAAYAKLQAASLHGGVIEVGPGNFAGFSIVNASQALTIRGRGTGQAADGSTNGEEVTGIGTYVTRFTTPVSIDVDTAMGGTKSWGAGLVLEDFAVAGVTGDGLTLRCPYSVIRNVWSCHNTGNGLVLTSSNSAGNYGSWFNTWQNCRFDSNGIWGMKSAAYAQMFINCTFDANNKELTGTGGGILIEEGAEEHHWLRCAIQRNGGAPSGGGMAFQANDGGPFVFDSVHSEGNSHLTAAYHLLDASIQAKFTNCRITASVSQYAVYTTGAINNLVVEDSTVSAITAAVRGASNGRMTVQRNSIGSAINVVEGANGQTIPAGVEGGSIIIGPEVRPAYTQSQSGTVTVSAISRFHRLRITSNTTLTVSAGVKGQVWTLSIIQGLAGGWTYSFPSNCKFAGGVAPSDTTAGTTTSVTFYFDGTNWAEIGRAVAVPSITSV